MSHTISPGTRLGPYEIQSLLGAGGMGEVYRARDSRLQRDVAVKVLPGALAAEKDRLRRFEREARAAGQLNHPNIMAVHDIGSTDANGGGLPYIVCELLEGATLRTKLATGPIPPRKAIQYATQVARGLAAAHAKGIAHRDLKPENLMILAGDHVKILDFGLAKLLHVERTADDDTGPVAGTLTITGAILGTPSYMSPEQVRDQPSDHRTDIFALGAILYEMLTGRRAFDGPSPADRMTAILTAEPPPLSTETEGAAPGIGAIIAHTLEKSPPDRFDSAGDLAFALSLITGRGGARAEPGSAETAPAAGPARPITYRRITLPEGVVRGARFAPDGQAIAYAASWEGNPLELSWSYPGNPEPRALGHTGTDLLSISSTGEMAVSRDRKGRGGFVFTGMLARMPLGGGAPRDIMDGVWEADFTPDGRRLAIVRDEAGMVRIEFPSGTVLYQTSGWVSSVRFSPDGTRFAFMDHPQRGNDAGTVAVSDLSGNVKRLATGWSSMRGLAWSPDGREVVFAAFRGAAAAGRELYAVDMNGVERHVLRIPGNMTMLDISRQGAALINLESERSRAQLIAGDKRRALTWLDWTLIRSLTPDGSRVLFDETGIGGGDLASAYIRGTDGSPAVRLGEGIAFSLSPDAKWALVGVGHSPTRLVVLPCGAGEPRTIPTGNVEIDDGSWFPDGKSVCCLASEPGGGSRLYRIDLATGARSLLSDEGISYVDCVVSPDGSSVAAHDTDRMLAIFPVDGGPPRQVKGALEYERVVGWSGDQSAIFVFMRGELPARMCRIDLKTGERKLVREISPPDHTGVEGLASLRMTPDASTFAYSYYQALSALYVVEGLL